MASCLPERYDPAHKPAIKRLLARARERNRQRDEIDREMGNGVPSGTPWDMQARLVIDAILSHMHAPSDDVLAEAVCLLQDLELQLRADPRSSMAGR